MQGTPKQRALQARSPASHNQMRAQKIHHPYSTKFHDDFNSPVAKRLKRHDSTDSSLSRNLSEDEENLREHSPARQPARVIADSEAESEADDEHFTSTARSTELESALPSVKTDKEAIREYEAIRAAEEYGELDLQARLGQRKWVPGKSSIYVDAFNLALETVLEDESHLFDEAEAAVFGYWRDLSYEAQYLYVIGNKMQSIRSRDTYND
jgi:Fanconi-associated nuclease 1